MTTDLPAAKKRKPPFSLMLPDDLDAYLRAKAAAAYRSVTKEIEMRLEHSRQHEALTPQEPPGA